jgi:hypothetical protein
MLLALIASVSIGYLDINFFNIKVVDRKVTSQNYNWKNGKYEWDEVRRNLNWEDGYIGFKPNYHNQLNKDLILVSSQYDDVQGIDWLENRIYSNQYFVQLCIEDKSITIRDTSLAKKIINVRMSAYLELYDKEGCDLLFKQKDRRYIINNKLVLVGLGKKEFLINKAEELLATEMCETIPEFIWRFEGPYLWQQKKRVVMNFMKLYYKDWSESVDQVEHAAFSKPLIETTVDN